MNKQKEKPRERNIDTGKTDGAMTGEIAGTATSQTDGPIEREITTRDIQEATNNTEDPGKIPDYTPPRTGVMKRTGETYKAA